MHPFGVPGHFRTGCVNPDVFTATSAWAINTAISVNVSGFPANLHSCVQTAFDNWNASKAANGSNATLNVVFNSPIATNGVTGVYQVTYQTPKDKNGNTTTLAGNTGGQTSGGNRINATTDVNPTATNCAAITETMAHEIGHTFGLGECSQCTAAQQSVMIGLPCGQRNSARQCVAPAYNDTTTGLPGPTPCDNNQVVSVYNPKVTAPGCNPDCPLPLSKNCIPCGGSPIIIDLNGEGFHLTNAQNGVSFDISGTSYPVNIAWTAQGADNGFLALPGPDGLVHGGKQLFGNFTPQPSSDTPNGFAALAIYDTVDHGGNGDGIIDSHDAVFASLRIWIDANHDGISQANELYTLPALHVKSISLDYRDSSRRDEYGNLFRYRARVYGDESTDLGRTAYDVFFVGELPATACLQKVNHAAVLVERKKKNKPGSLLSQ